MHHAPEVLKKEGHKLTPQRLLIWSILEEGKHFTANEIHEKVKKKFPGVDLVTVYRTLELLTKNSFIQESTFSSGPARYEITNQIGHIHIVCGKCKKIEHFEDEKLHELVKGISNKKGFDTKASKISISSICKDCTTQVN